MAFDLAAAAPPQKQDISRRFDQIMQPESIDSWTKSKRTKRVYEGTEEEQLATCLVLLARGGSPPSSTTTPNVSDKKPLIKKTKSSIVVPPQNHIHKCSLCNKVFNTYHALGGHKASHRGKPPTTTAGAAVANSKIHTSALTALNPSGRLHTCSICQLSFSSGQALGGHKRKHYEGVISSTKSRTTTSSEGGRGDKSGITSEVGGASQLTVVAVPRNFDLNMPPSPEFYCEEEVESALPPIFK